ncbi:hypothetical protein BDP55DRAFT_691527 [Colletotrichum godetiae]|uniref:Calcineurin-like phosphoesterase domain-containing protein n=1 Tax=Colletotrichum godetiae TaxID=1209918 RepID=A0AAJ0AS39_9PEZI|nr:uncharacterized protein BDP55DRAFT_691527 [Colletotrichum godetiae]KAK1689358.1 hypothetical protein BDP55DRAFT_691527 [Colletotrichum godetiae]
MKQINTVIPDLSVTFCASSGASAACSLEQQTWNRPEKDLYLQAGKQTAWMYLEERNEVDITNGNRVPTTNAEDSWEERPCGIWILKTHFTDHDLRILTGIHVLFGKDAIDSRPGWTLLRAPLQLDDQPDVPAPRISARYSRPLHRPGAIKATLRVHKDGKLKIVQISDTHMVTGSGVCNDAIDADRRPLPISEADPNTIQFFGDILDVEKPDLVILSGDQVHHGVSNTQTPLFKVVSLLISRSIPFAVIFWNHDDEGIHALSREKQMSILQDLPCCLAEPGLTSIDSVGNYYL